MKIRKEEERDYDEVYDLVKTAFDSAEHADGNEQDLVKALRKSSAFVPELSLVAEENGKITGHIMFTEVRIGDKTGLALAPLSVLPECQNQGIGMELIKEGHRIASQMGYGISVVVGSERYYPKAGYQKAEDYGVKDPFHVPSENFMICGLGEEIGKYQGTVLYAEEFYTEETGKEQEESE